MPGTCTSEVDPVWWSPSGFSEEASQMPKTRPPYAPEFRRQMVELVRAGRDPAELAREFEPTAQSISHWVAQAGLRGQCASPRRAVAVDPGAAGHAILRSPPLHSDCAIRRPLTGSAQPAAPLPHAPSPRACSRSSEPAGRHARSRVVPSAAARPPPVRCERSMLASSIPQTWYAFLSTLPHLGTTGSRYKMT